MRPVDLLCQLDRLPDASRRSVLERLDEPTLTDLVARGETVEAGAEPARLDSIDRLLVTGGGGLEGDLWDRLAAEIADEPEGHAALVGEEIGPVRIEGVLGRGGMGAVYRGFDTWLERPVAVKTLHDRFGRREDALERFRSEARLLSRLDHPNVCRIYGLQRFAGREFLVLELIEGTPLSELDLSTLDRGERLRIGRDVAAALIAAHERRVVHRDLKPANVMITEEGRAKVLDFGISQPFEAEDVAIGLEADAGAVIGTPRYMSPEQARGETPTPASDLYSFGLLLHELFTGRSARPEGHGLAASLDTAQRAETDLDDDLAPPLRRLIDGLLAPEPKGRPDAEATAEALRRIDEGPLRRRRRWIIAAGLALAALGMLATLSISRWRLERQAAFAQRFTQEVKDLEARIRTAYLLPPHDIRPDKNAVRQRLAELESEIERAGALAFGPGHLALGRGYLALDDAQRARELLEAAWERGYRPPEMATAYGLALGKLLERDRDIWRPTGNAERDQRRLRSLEARAEEVAGLLRTGLDAPQRVAAGPAVAAYPAALQAFYDERLDEALVLAGRAREEATWLYTPQVLEGDILKRQADLLRNAGEYPQAGELYAHADAAYAGAARLGESDPEVYEARCDLAGRWMQHVLYGTGGDLEPLYRQGLRACEQALTIDPTRAMSHLALSGLHQRWAEAALDQDRDVGEALTAAVEASRRAIELEPDFQRAHGRLGSALLHLADHEARAERDGLPTIERAIAAFERAIELDPSDVDTFSRHGQALRVRGRIVSSRGEDPQPSFEAAAASYVRATEIDPDCTYCFNNLGILRTAIARHLRSIGADAEPALLGGIEALERSLAINPQNSYAANNLGDAWIVVGELRAERGVDPSTAFETAIEAFERALAVKETSAPSWNNIGLVTWHLGRWELLVGGDPRPRLIAAREALDRAVELVPAAFQPVANQARLHWLEAEAALARGEDPTPAVARSLAVYDTLLERKNFPIARVEAAGATLVAVHDALGDGERPRDAAVAAKRLHQARKLADDGLALGLVDAKAHEVLGRIELVQAGLDEQPLPALDRAEAHVDQAIEHGGATTDRLILQAEIHRRRAERLASSDRPSADARDAAHRAVERALTRHPDHPRALRVLEALGPTRPASG